MLELIKKELILNPSLTSKFFIVNFRLASLFYTSGRIKKIFIINVIILKYLNLSVGLIYHQKQRLVLGSYYITLKILSLMRIVY